LMGQQNTRHPSAARRAECSLRRAGLRRSWRQQRCWESSLADVVTRAKLGQLAAKQVSAATSTASL